MARRGTRAQLAGGHGSSRAPVTVPRAAASPALADRGAQGADALAASRRHRRPACTLVRATARPDGVAIYQATVLGKPSSSDALGTFFEGIRIP